MKNHEQMYQSLLSRWDEYQEQEKKLLFERKHRIKKMCLVLALTASAIVGCMSLGFGGYAVWNYVVKPIIIEEKEPEPTVTSNISVVTQITKTTEPTQITKTTEPTQTTKITEPTETTVTSAVVTETPAETTVKVTVTTAEPVTGAYEEESYTEAEYTTTVTETTTVTTTTEAVTTKMTTTTKMYERYLRAPTHMQPLILTSKGTYQVRKHCIDKSELDNYEITWKDDYSLNFFEYSPIIKPSYDLEFTDTIEIMGVNDEDDPDKYIIAYFPLQDVYALYELLPDSMEEGLKLWNEKRNGGDTDG